MKCFLQSKRSFTSVYYVNSENGKKIKLCLSWQGPFTAEKMNVSRGDEIVKQQKPF